MAKAKKIAVAVICTAAAAAIGVTAFTLWKKKNKAAEKGTVYVQKVSDLNTVGGLDLTGVKFSGVVETQKTQDVKYDTEKTIAEFYVAVDDVVKKGDKLFCYDVEELNLKYDQAKIELERMQNEVDTNKIQLEELEKEKAKATADAQSEYTMQILSLQSDIAKAEYDIKTQKNENKKLKDSIKNSDVFSPIDGVVKSILDLDGTSTSTDEYSDEGYGGGAANVAVSISKGDDMQIRASVNEQMIELIYTDMPVLLRSRIDENVTWKGTVSNIETTPQSGGSGDEMYYEGGEEDSANISSKYAFYIIPENFDGLMLGQHLLVEPDDGSADSEPKDGLWLYSDFIVKEDGKTYVWAANSKDRLEKREVKLGREDEEAGDVEIVDGLKEKDLIAYPDKGFAEGMKTTKDPDKATVPKNDGEDPDADVDIEGAPEGAIVEGEDPDGELEDGADAEIDGGEDTDEDTDADGGIDEAVDILDDEMFADGE